MQLIEVTYNDKVRYFTKEQVLALRKNKNHKSVKEYLWGEWFLDQFRPDWMELYGQITRPSDSNIVMSLRGKSK